MPVRRKLIAGNWKMNGLRAAGLELAKDLAGRLERRRSGRLRHAGLPARHARPFRRGSRRRHPPGGRRPGLPRVEVGRPYRRHQRRDAGRCRRTPRHRRPFRAPAEPWRDDALVSAKATAAHAAGLIAIVCVGETRSSARPARRSTWSGSQVTGSIPAGATAANTVIAYEPVWAIGTGKTPTAADVAEVHAHIRKTIDRQDRESRTGPHPLWRLGQAVERRGTAGGGQCRRRPGRRRQPRR